MNLVAILFLAIMQNGFNLLSLPPYLMLILRGVLLVIALMLDVFRRRYSTNS
jgi:ribose/xylose/arabinose/galactoside ABC-type transport system permease subunit